MYKRQEQDLFDEVVARGIQIFTKDSPDLILNLAWSSTGWETGVGLVALTTDNLKTVDDFRYNNCYLYLPLPAITYHTLPLKYPYLPHTIITYLSSYPYLPHTINSYPSSYYRQAVAAVDANDQRFVTLPKQMLLRKYALTAYFGRQFAIFDTPRLMYWLGLCNNLSGQFELVETRLFSKTHDNPRRRGARIVAFEGNQEFLDCLQRYPKDYPFNIRFGGNIYIRGGDRYAEKQVFTLTKRYTYSKTIELKKKITLILTQILPEKNVYLNRRGKPLTLLTLYVPLLLFQTSNSRR